MGMGQGWWVVIAVIVLTTINSFAWYHAGKATVRKEARKLVALGPLIDERIKELEPRPMTEALDSMRMALEQVEALRADVMTPYRTPDQQQQLEWAAIRISEAMAITATLWSMPAGYVAGAKERG